METKYYYFVGVSKTKKILGFNLTEKEKNKIFYHKDTGGGHRSGENRFYGATTFKTANLKDLETVLNLREQFKNCNEYSYIILNSQNKWLATGYKETEKTVFDTIKKLNTDDIIIFETRGLGIKL